jgi:hypothetical protein
MPSIIRSILTTGVAIGSLASTLNVGEALAGVSNRRVVAFYPDHAFAGPEAAVMVVFEIGGQLQFGDSVENRFVLPIHHLCQQLLGILVAHCVVLRLTG